MKWWQREHGTYGEGVVCAVGCRRDIVKKSENGKGEDNKICGKQL